MYDGDNDADDFEALLSTMSPEELQQILGLGTMDERGALLQQQMAQAEALRQPSGRQYSTGWGAALGGLGDAAKFIAGSRQMDKTQAGLEELLGKKDAGRGLYVDAMRRRATAPQQDVIPAVPFGL